jgi:hypothetical protein
MAEDDANDPNLAELQRKYGNDNSVRLREPEQTGRRLATQDVVLDLNAHVVISQNSLDDLAPSGAGAAFPSSG